MTTDADEVTLWSLQPIRDPAPPAVEHSSWPTSVIDSFILARLEEADLAPAPRAGSRELLRRVTFDLVGLPPTPEEVESFVRDDSPDALAKVVDRLLASPRHGERWGRHWLDVVRYADSNGADESVPFPNAYRFRNWVIGAFNRDLPFDRFVHEQVAGDLLPQDDPEEDTDPLIGTGFLVLGTKIVAEKDLAKMDADIVDEQIDTLGRAFLGMSLGCARCHDHKFDPIPTTDYYGLAGIFKSTRTMASPGKWLERPLRSGRGEELTRRRDAELARKRKKVEQLEETFRAVVGSAGGVTFEAETFARGNVVVDRERYGKGIGIVGDLGVEEDHVEWDVDVVAAGDHVVLLRYAAASPRPARVLVNGVLFEKPAMTRSTGSWMPDGQRWFSEGKLSLRKGKNVLRLETQPHMSHLDKLGIVPAQSSGGVVDALKTLEALHAELASSKSAASTSVQVMAVDEGTVQNVRVHLRGSHTSPGEEVPRRFPDAIGGDRPDALPEGQSGRLELARWLTSATHPLTSRVIANRVWGWHFGRGIVGTPDDFGTRGEAPSHPLLLDHLSRHLRESGWSLKALHRRIVLSSTYGMTASGDPIAAGVDPDNRLLGRFGRRRLEAEAIRDALLEMGGGLDRGVGGAPLEVGTYNLSPADVEKNRVFCVRSRRRSVYLPVVRTNVYDFLTLFDFPNADLSTGERATTTLPTQALFLMNSPWVIEQAGHIVRRSMAGARDDEALVRGLFLVLFSRPPSEAETRVALEFVGSYAATLDVADAETRRVESWTGFCQALIASDEFIVLR